MRQIILVTMLLSLTTLSFGQTQKESLKKLYLEVGAGPSNNNGILAEFGIRSVLKNNWTASISYHALDMNPKNLPADYERGFTLLILFPIPDEMPAEKMKLFNFTAGKFFELGRKTWFTTEAGLSIVNGEKMTFTRQSSASSGLHFPSNYSTQNESQTTIGGILKADLNWAFSKYVGLGVGGFANFNSIQSPVGMEIKLIIGRLNTAKKSKT